MKIINLMPHAYNLVSEGQVVLTIPPSGAVARCEEKAEGRMPLYYEGAEIPVNMVTYGDTNGLPPEEYGVLLLVSALVRQANPDRKDLFSPGALARNAAGQPIGAAGLVGNF